MNKIQSLLQKAMQAIQSRQLEKAERLYRDVLKTDPNQFDANYHLGVLFLQNKSPDKAVPHFLRAIQVNPTMGSVHASLGGAYRDLRQMDLAIASFQKAIQAEPANPGFYNGLACLYSEAGRKDQALVFFFQALRVKPDYAEAHFNLANLFHEQGRFEEALRLYDQTLIEKPGFVQALVNRGIALCNLGQYNTAIQAFRDVLAADPNNAAAYNNLGVALRYTGDPQSSIECYEKAIQIAPLYYEAYVNFGTALRDCDDLNGALEKFTKAHQIQPQNPTALMSLGTMAQDFGDLEKALSYYDQALALRPNFVDVQWNKALALLGLGQMKEGWSLYEEGLKDKAFRGQPYKKGKEWKGEDLSGKTLLIWCEQGLGDAMQFGRYAQVCKEKGARVIFKTYEPVIPLFQRTPFFDEVVADCPDDAYDYQISVMSLPCLMGTTLETIPQNVPYLFHDEDKSALWKKRMTFDGLKVGIVWAGQARREQVNANLFDKRRSLDLSVLAPLLSCDGVQFYSLQKGEPSAQIKALGLQDRIIDWTDELSSFADTADLVANLDLVISVDTSVVHLAGGMGKPVWVLSRYDACWRWQRNAETNPWYPSARVFGQQKYGCWDDVVEKVRGELPVFAQSMKKAP